MRDVDLMFKALRLAWIPRLLNAGDKNWCSMPNYYFRKQGGLNFVLKCNFDTKYFPQLPAVYKNILRFFHELKILYGYDQASDLVQWNPAITKCHGTEKIVRYNGVFAIAKTPL